MLTLVAMLGILWVGVSEAKVCRIGEPGCETNGFYGVGEAQCDSSYIRCSNPRAGAVYCYGIPSTGGSAEALYKPEDCCSELVSSQGYDVCPINDGLAGYGRSCHGAADNITYWQHCGCSYGFVEVDASGVANGGVVEDDYGNVLDYGERCHFADWGVGNKCRFGECDEERRFFHTNSGSHCKYRLETRCGGLGCMQVYDCNHDEVGPGKKEYYRNENEYLSEGVVNFIPYLGSDPVANERRHDNGAAALITALVSEDFLQNPNVYYEDYNVVNRYVCSYELEDGTTTGGDIEDEGKGFDCNAVQNYCYLWDGCNNERHWYNNASSEPPADTGIVYDSPLAHAKWMEIVEKDGNYNAYGYELNNHGFENPFHLNFYTDASRGVNLNYGVYTRDGDSIDAVNGSHACSNGACTMKSAENGCTYIIGDCHQDGSEYPDHRCWKKISCTEENRFYASFINAAPIDANGNPNTLYESSMNTPYWEAYYYDEDSGNLILQENEIYPACVYEINNCNDDSGCYRKLYRDGRSGCVDGFEDIRDHENLEIDWEPWFRDLRPICNDSTRCYKATACELSLGAYSSVPNTSFFVTINSTATGLTCYKGIECDYEIGVYSSEPNTSFFEIGYEPKSTPRPDAVEPTWLTSGSRPGYFVKVNQSSREA